jgi:glycosyltransferase involved in cell wall biosynthesis
MRIGVMLRTIEDKAGIGVYSRNLMDHLLPIDQKNEYILFYRNPEFIGHYAHFNHVREKIVAAPNKLIWDQAMVPLEARREGLDVLFHTKFTLPLFAPCKTAMVMHGSAWYVHPEAYTRSDLLYIKAVMPFYCRKADVVISVSDRATVDLARYAGANPKKFTTVYNAPDDRFFKDPGEEMIRTVKEKYNLPERFILNVGGLSTEKNIKNLLRAFALMHNRVPHKLVIAGVQRTGHSEELKPIADLNLTDDVVFPGWIDQRDLPVLLRLADLFILPSWYESCSIALLEAMASGCAIVTSNTGGTPEIIGNAAAFVEPGNPDNIAEVTYAVLSDEERRARMEQESRKQGKLFSWDRCARETLAALNSLA